MPASPHVADTLGWAYYKLRMMDAAIGQFKSCAQMTPTTPSCHYHLGLAYMASGNRGMAERSLLEALKGSGFRYPVEAKEALGKLARP